MAKERQQPTNPFSQMEGRTLEFWQKAKIFEKSVSKEAPHGDYIFYDGPPFITGLPHYATLLPSIAKDVIPRFWTMKGYRVERVWGWDCHGLPAENKVEKELNLKNKKDIEALGIGKFVDACRNYVTNASEQWKWYIDRIARWVDMEHAYKTMDLNYMESVLWAFKELYEKGLIYEGYRTSLHCPRCATPLSKFEVTMDAGSYRDIEDDTVVIKLAARGADKTYFLAWTTTPWTLPGNLALAVGENIIYAQVQTPDGENYILAKDKIARFFSEKKYKIVNEFKGNELVGRSYEPLFNLKNPAIDKNKQAYLVYAADFVNIEDGTGIVHIAPNFGEDDFNLGQRVSLPLVELMDENGAYTAEAGNWAGQYFEKANKLVMEKLGDKLFERGKYVHSYPFCYRCGTKLIQKAQKAWYLNVEKLREQMIAKNKDINWVPEHFKLGRFQYNIENAPDWCLSRSRYWGSPLPVWKCADCGALKIPGSLAEIEKMSGKKITDLHRPAIDDVEFHCQCGGKMKRVPEVLDCWFESAAMPFAQFHYPMENQKKWSHSHPADFIIEYTGQLRGWFYYLHVIANALFQEPAFKNVIVTGVLAGTDGRKMSKSYGNYPDPKATLEKYGADALRMYFMSSSIMLGGDTSLNEKDIQDALRKNVILLWNVVKFYSLFAEKNTPANQEPDTDNVLDQWILLRLHELYQNINNGLEKYDLPSACRPVAEFIDELSTWYVRRSRDRFKGENEQDAAAARATVHYVLSQLSLIIAPIMPFLAEEIWQTITEYAFNDENQSVHLQAWPVLTTRFDKKQAAIISTMAQTRKIAELGLAKRDEAGIKVRQPLAKITVYNCELPQEYVNILKDELNVKEVILKPGHAELSVELDTVITDELKQEGLKRDIIRLFNALRKDAGLTVNDKIKAYYHTDDKLAVAAIKTYTEEIKKGILAVSLTLEKPDGCQIEKQEKIGSVKIWLGINKK